MTELTRQIKVNHTVWGCERELTVFWDIKIRDGLEQELRRVGEYEEFAPVSIHSISKVKENDSDVKPYRIRDYDT